MIRTKSSKIDPCDPMADLIASALLAAAEGSRRWLYVWEQKACLYMLDRLDEDTYTGVDWTKSFLELNREAIRSSPPDGNPKINLNLRDARIMRAEHATKGEQE